MASKQEILERRDEIMGMMLRGQSTHAIMKFIRSRYEVSKSTVEKDVSACYQDIRKKYDRDLPEVISNHIAKYEEIHKQAMGMGDFRSAIMALQGIEKLLKLYHEQPLIQLNQNNLKLDGLSLTELKQLLNGDT